MTIKYVFELCENGDGMTAKVTNCEETELVGTGNDMQVALNNLCYKIEAAYQKLKKKEGELTEQENKLKKFLKINRYKDSGWYLERVS